MKTDALIYQLFQFDPQSLCTLAQLDVDAVYDFHSITLKNTEKRLDGFFQSEDITAPNIFFESQGYPDPKIYWRLFREITMYYELYDDPRPFVAVVLFLDPADDPGAPPIFSSDRVIRLNLADCLAMLEGRAGPWTVLKPLLLAHQSELPEEAKHWKKEIQGLNLPEHKEQNLIELLVYAVTQRFSDLTAEEILTMAQLTPLSETRSVRELTQRALNQGELQILTRLLEQRFGALSSSLQAKLSQASHDELEAWSLQLLDANSLDDVFH